MRPIFQKCFALCLIALMLAALNIPVAADVVVEPWYYLFTPMGAITAGLLVLGVVLITVLLIRYFFEKKRHDDKKDQ